jgi:effector-binding domain-containing protein
MRILKTILIGLAALLVLLVIGGLLLPSSAQVQRTTLVAAPAPAVFEVVNSFKRFNEWSPWYELDPAARYVYSGPEQGVGARFEWVSQKPELGSGSQEIVASVPNERVRAKLDFGSQGIAEAEFTIVPAGEGSEVTWSFEAQFGYDLLQRYFGLLYERWIGADYEKGLANLKALVEGGAAAPTAQAMQIRVATIEPIDIVSIEGATSLDPAHITQALDAAYGQLASFMKSNGLEQAAARLAINRFYDESGWGFEAAVPFKASADSLARAQKAANGGPIKVTRTYAGQIVRGTHVGPHEGLPDAYRQLEDYMAAKKLEPNGHSWEQYVTESGRAPPEEQRTEVFMPVKPQS